MQIGMFKEICTLPWNKSNISGTFYARALLRRSAPVFQSASFYRYCTVGAFTCTGIGRDECPVLLLSFCSANMTPDLPGIRHARSCALIETRHTIKRALRRMEIFAGRCCIPLVFSPACSRPDCIVLYFLPRKRNKETRARERLFFVCSLIGYYLSSYLCESTSSSIIFI